MRGWQRGIGWLRRSRAEIAGDIDEEIAFHLQMRAAELMRGGMSEKDANVRARAEFGDADELRAALQRRDESVQRRARVSLFLDELKLDVRFASRSLSRTPGFSIVALCTFAVAIGSAVAMFTVVNAVVLKSLPYADADRLVQLSPGQNFNITMAESLEAGTPSLAAVSGVSQWELALTGAGPAAAVAAQAVEPAFFDVFATRPAMGRAFREDDRAPGAPGVVILSDAEWRIRFGGDEDVVGRSIALDGYGHETREVVGVMPAGFTAPLTSPGRPIDVWIPLTSVAGRTVATDSTWYVNAVVARMRPDAEVERVASEVRSTMERLRTETSQIADDAVRSAGAARLQDAVVGDTPRVLWTLLGAVGLVLVLACANLANLMLARGARRRHELAARAALGASRARLVRELITESALLAAAGATAGILLARLTLQALRVADTSGLPRMTELGMDVRVLLFAVVLTSACVVLFGLLPALRVTGGDLRPSLGPGARVRGQSPGGRRLGGLLIGGEVALATVLVTAAGLLITSFRTLRAVDPGLDAGDVVSMRVTPPPAGYGGGRAIEFYDELLSRLEQLPGVRSAAAIHLLPFTLGNWSFPYLAEGHLPPVDGPLPSANFRVVTPRYFAALDIGIIAGRAFDDRDRSEAPAVVVINRTLAQELWPAADPIGREILLFGSSPLRVVGVVEDVRQHGLDESPRPELYRPLAQWPLAAMTVTIETAGNTASLALLAPQIVRSIDEDVAVLDVMPLADVIDESLARRRFYLGVLTAFGAVALLLGVIGTYGVMTYSAGARTAEFGIRVALGATDAQVLRLALAAGLVPVAIGLIAGAAASLASGRLLAGMLFGIQPHDARTLVVACVVLGAAAALAAWLPARRFSRVAPMRVLGSQ